MKKLITLFIGSLIISCGSSPKPQFHDNIVVVHRGAWKANSLPENSIVSLKQAIVIGAHGSEFDVHITADDSLEVHHDDDYKGMLIQDTPYKELMIEKLSNGEQLPTLRAYLKEGLKQNTTKLILEIKKTKSPKRTLTLTRMVVNLGKEINAEKWVDYITFNYETGKLVHELNPNAKIAYLKGDVSPSQAKKDGYTGLDYNINRYRKNPEWIPEARTLGMSINAWTVNSKGDMIYMMDQNAEYITTNEPELLLQFLTDKK